MGGMLFYAGRGLLNRSQMSRRIQIGLALVIAYSGSFSIFTYGERFTGAVVLCLSMGFVILMFLPSIRTQFVDTRSEEKKRSRTFKSMVFVAGAPKPSFEALGHDT